MNVRTRLAGAFALYIALLAGLSLYHIRTTRRAVASGRALAEIASRFRATSTTQLGRIARSRNYARKYSVTRDKRYLADGLDTTMAAFNAELRTLDATRLTPVERRRLDSLKTVFHVAQLQADSLHQAPAGRDSVIVESLQATFDRAATATAAVSAASQQAMSQKLVEADEAEQSAEDFTLVAAGGAVLLSLLLSAVLARSILNPLAMLTTGTHEISAGRFGYRLNASGSDELAQVARDFNSMTERLDELDKMKRDFVSKVSHDLKTPLSSMQETTGALLDGVAGPINANQRKLLAINHESGQRLHGMLTKLLDLSRLEAGFKPELHVVDARQLVRRSFERISDGSARGRVSLTLGDGVAQYQVKADAEGLSQVVDNLLDNALKFSPSDGTVRVRIVDFASRSDKTPAERWNALQRPAGNRRGAVLITVADEGPGVPDAEKEKIFTRFYQSESGRAVQSRGVGLGLTICQEIVTAHGGVIWVSDNEPCGSVFNILLPEAVRVAGDAASEPAFAAARGRDG
ncbi:MAG: ATP-binding protein [Gemmatimonadaceae bacterium]